jgi:hypothetical protein
MEMFRLGKVYEKEDLAEVIAHTLEELGNDEYTISELADMISDAVLADTMWIDEDGEIKSVCKDEVQRLAGVVEEVRDALSEIRRKVCGM